MARSIRKLLAPALLVAALAAGHALTADDAPRRTAQADTSWGTPPTTDESTPSVTSLEVVDGRASKASGDTSWG
ncbi:hypothetical protein [Streptomyces lasiicapitis]|uniref:hypothetical protein n=1 Tax=Streptomyces lasiicapitis TaxID=1923961 RepID=UPI0036C966BF